MIDQHKKRLGIEALLERSLTDQVVFLVVLKQD